MQQLFHYLTGYCTLEIRGPFGEQFLSACNRNAIQLWHTVRAEPYIIHAKISLWQSRQLDEIAQKTRTEVLITNKLGLPPVLHRYRHRWGILAGAVLFCAILGFLSTFLWTIDITGNDKVRRYDVLQFLREQGFYEGTRTADHDIDYLNFLLRKEFDSLAFAAIHMYGCKAVVELTESTPIPDMVPQSVPCNLIASHDAQILTVEVYDGKALVKPGDAVRKGQLLVSGVLESKRIGYRLVHAAAKIEARVLEVLTQTVPLTETVRLPTGRTETGYILHLFGKPIVLKKGMTEGLFNTESRRTDLHFRNFVFPIGFETVTYTEVTEEMQLRTEEEAVAEAETQLKELARVAFVGVTVEDKTADIQVSRNQVTVTHCYTLRLEITQNKEIYQKEKE